jgi:hypothetical protein
LLPEKLAQAKAVACELPSDQGVPLSRFSRSEPHWLVIRARRQRGVARDGRSLAGRGCDPAVAAALGDLPREPEFLERPGVLDLYRAAGSAGCSSPATW